MNDIYAVAVSVSQSGAHITATATASHRQEDTRTSVSLAWTGLPALNADGDVGTWLYGVLSQMVYNFDDHDVTEADTEGLEQMKEAPRA